MCFIGTFVLSIGFKICALLNEIKIQTVSYVQYHSLTWTFYEEFYAITVPFLVFKHILY